jgi:hypothetical protein
MTAAIDPRVARPEEQATFVCRSSSQTEVRVEGGKVRRLKVRRLKVRRLEGGAGDSA